MVLLHPSLLAALASDRGRTAAARHPSRARPLPRRRRLAEREPAPQWGGGATVRPLARAARAAGAC
ncbi:MAG TPA: hypothetical protein VLB47_02495 [Solirubrobacteraceae bacterium]|nr:hypothetical protein [Solirubrobacteraceae bacterium]